MSYIFAIVISTIATTASAQIYVVDTLIPDSVTVYSYQKSAQSASELPCEPSIKLAQGDTLVALRPLEGNPGIVAFKRDGHNYCIRTASIMFSSTNPEDVEDPYNTLDSTNHQQWKKMMASPLALLSIAGLFVLAYLLSFFGFRIKGFRWVAFQLVPVLLLAGSIGEILLYLFVGSNGMFWWCSPDRYGFWGSFFRTLPFFVLVVVQVVCFFLCKNLYLGKSAGFLRKFIFGIFAVIYCLGMLVSAFCVIGLLMDIFWQTVIAVVLGVGVIGLLGSGGNIKSLPSSSGSCPPQKYKGAYGREYTNQGDAIHSINQFYDQQKKNRGW